MFVLLPAERQLSASNVWCVFFFHPRSHFQSNPELSPPLHHPTPFPPHPGAPQLVFKMKVSEEFFTRIHIFGSMLSLPLLPPGGTDSCGAAEG